MQSWTFATSELFKYAIFFEKIELKTSFCLTNYQSTLGSLILKPCKRTRQLFESINDVTIKFLHIFVPMNMIFFRKISFSRRRYD